MRNGSAVLIGLTSVLFVLLFHADARLVHELHAGLGHHALHVGMPVLAFVIFAAGVARDVRRHGWPAFSWRLR